MITDNALKEVERQIKEIGQCGKLPEGGVYRGLYTPAWKMAVDKIQYLMKKAGLSTYQDAVGNVFGSIKGTKETDKIILIGSHIDTVLNGGNYDGLLGILAGIAAVQYLNQKFGPPQTTLEVVATCEEEGSRFDTSFWGTRAILGMLTSEEASKYVDKQGKTIDEAMQENGFSPERIPEAHRTDIKTYLELHIEQGGVLEKEEIPVGVVEAITGIKQFEVVITGLVNHAGTTPMALRKDAARAAAEMISAIGNIADELDAPAVATVGDISLKPGAKNIVAGKAFFTIDARHPDEETLDLMEEKILAACKEIAIAKGVSVAIKRIVAEKPVKMFGELIKTLSATAEAEGIRYHQMVSGAGHDASLFGNVVDAAMIFVPSKDGKSHCPEEYTSVEDFSEGIKLLSATLHKLAY